MNKSLLNRLLHADIKSYLKGDTVVNKIIVENNHIKFYFKNSTITYKWEQIQKVIHEQSISGKYAFMSYTKNILHFYINDGKIFEVDVSRQFGEASLTEKEIKHIKSKVLNWHFIQKRDLIDKIALPITVLISLFLLTLYVSGLIKFK